ncbi:hypothetical protein [Lolliginicoccus levis]|uniref:hypothetical protein n=1 Tax=Lolliginicoccus levis TaxID=2919542 RepID=UPI00285288E4|nr:hypothetical protein [Lolliginicoccus levis]
MTSPMDDDFSPVPERGSGSSTDPGVEGEPRLTNPPVEPSEPLRAAVRYGAYGLVVLAIVGVVAGFLFAGLPGVWGALLGAALGGGFILFTAVSVLFSERLPMVTGGAVVLGGWAIKMLLALIVFATLSRFTFYSQPVMALVVIGALVLVLGAETYGVLKHRVPYVQPEEEPVNPATKYDDE